MKNILICLLLLALTACGQATALEYGADVNRGPCASGFTRTAPGVCTRPIPVSPDLDQNDAGCSAIPGAVGIPSTARTVTAEVTLYVFSGNSIALRSSGAPFYDTVGCAGNIVGTITGSIREFVAATAGTVLGSWIVPVPDIPLINGQVYAKCNAINAVGTGCSYYFTKYTD